MLGFVTTGCFIRWVEKEFRTNGYYTLENECYNKEELIGGSIGTGAVYDDNSKFKWQGAAGQAKSSTRQILISIMFIFDLSLRSVSI